MGHPALTYQPERSALKLVYKPGQGLLEKTSLFLEKGLEKNDPKPNFCLKAYRYGFNGMENDDEIAGEGNSYTTEFRQYDPRLGRWWKTDPKADLMPFETPYSFANNMPIIGNDPDGDICVPCVLILIGFVTAPSVAVAPSGSPEDAIAIKNAYDLQRNWIMYSIMLGGFTSGALGKQFIKEIGKQYSTQLIGNTAVEGYKSWSEDRKFNLVNNVLLESFKSLDFFDAYIGKFNMSKIAKAALSASIDISPDEAQVLGLSKDATSVTVDAFFGIISEFTNNKIVKGRYGKVFKKLMAKADDSIQQQINKEIKEQLGEEDYNRFLEEVEGAMFDDSFNKNINPRDNTNVSMPTLENCEDCN